MDNLTESIKLQHDRANLVMERNTLQEQVKQLRAELCALYEDIRFLAQPHTHGDFFVERQGGVKLVDICPRCAAEERLMAKLARRDILPERGKGE